jgi:hypothetical protein
MNVLCSLQLPKRAPLGLAGALLAVDDGGTVSGMAVTGDGRDVVEVLSSPVPLVVAQELARITKAAVRTRKDPRIHRLRSQCRVIRTNASLRRLDSVLRAAEKPGFRNGLLER